LVSLEIELKAHKKELENAIQINQDSKAMAEKTGQVTVITYSKDKKCALIKFCS